VPGHPRPAALAGLLWRAHLEAVRDWGGMKISLPGTGSAATGGNVGQGVPWIRRGEPHPLSALLFGKRPPKLVDRRKHPKLRRGLRKLELIGEQVSDILGAPSSLFSVELCEGDNASISRQGQIAFGLELLERHQGDDDLLVAVMGHEIGHQPWTWPQGDLSGLNRRQLDALYREEEAKADRFSGRVLAELGLSPDAVSEFLLASAHFEAHPPTDYYPASTRVKMIREAYARRRRALDAGMRWSPAHAARARELR
jgi:hypothetical protein